MSRCLEGVLPLAFAEQLLSGGRATTGAIGRGCASWSASGPLTPVPGWRSRSGRRPGPRAGRSAANQHPDRTGPARFLWAVRVDKPWTSCGKGAHGFRAVRPMPCLVASHLESCPDLLLFAEECRTGRIECPDSSASAPAGKFQTRCSPQPADHRGQGLRPSSGANYQLLVDEQVFWFAEGPDRLSRRLERWCHYFFADFAPSGGCAGPDRTSAATDRLRAREGTAAPNVGDRACRGEANWPCRFKQMECTAPRHTHPPKPMAKNGLHCAPRAHPPKLHAVWRTWLRPISVRTYGDP